MRRFDPKALYSALDAERLSRGVSWKQVAAETGVSGSTISRTQRGGRMEVDGVLALVGWLGVPVESFTRETPF
jgi:transcriptional regulator with XRE-family HTH domain